MKASKDFQSRYWQVNLVTIRHTTIFALILAGCGAPSHLREVDGEMMLIGEITQTELLREFPIFQSKRAAYLPSVEAVLEIRDAPQTLHAKVFLGSWCDDSQEHVPALIKTLDVAERDDWTFEYHALDRTKRDAAGLAEAHGVEYVPTMIFYENGTEIGRIVEFPEYSIEWDLAVMLRGGDKAE